MSIEIQRNSKTKQVEKPKIKLNKSLLTACEELERIADSLENDKRIKVTAKGVNAINREFKSNIDLHAIRKLKFDDFKDDFDRPISPVNIANELKYLAKKVIAREQILQHIGNLADVEKALQIDITSHLFNKSELVKYMRQNNLKFKQEYSLNEPHRLYWGKRDDYEKHFFFPFQYRPKTATEIEREKKQAERIRKAAAKKSLQTKRKNEKADKKRRKSADKITQEIANRIDEYLLNSDPTIPLFLDTETTGLGAKDEVIEIAIVDINNTVIIDTLIYTKRDISYDAYEVNNIKKSEIESMPKFKEMQNQISKLIKDRDLYIFNADFDIEKMKNSATNTFNLEPRSTNCLMYLAMRKFNQHYYISLANACERLSVDCGDHRALNDTLASIRLYKAMIAK
ncbi:3'-5' exonuclease [Psychrobacter sp. N25K4-3-2]|uniref:3'-5' exonuclease n=1 Tax=unclassified Psychrobacter TaxID=196806 RepID=UPI00188C2086|nr:3'-5' exonuclease [Psychrobacter sp. N25K4-3-2]MBF4490824.1 3'-5' exonuclease [Psychrobacter sp. N25K4-3-2]